MENSPHRGDAPPVFTNAALVGAVLALSSASILIKAAEAEGTGLLTIAALRMLTAAALLLPLRLALVRPFRSAQLPTASERRPGPRSTLFSLGFGKKDGALLVASGLLLATHFATWTRSLAEIPIARSVLLVSTHPVFTAVGERVFLGRPLARSTLVGAGLALAGTLGMLAGGDGLGRAGALGDGLALIGAISLSAYFLLGRHLRSRLSLIDYGFPLYAVTGGAILAAACLFGEPLALPTAPAAAAILGLAVLPTLLGHLVMSWAIRHLAATAVSTAFLGEAVGASVLAWALLGQVPGVATVGGGGVVLAGLAIVLSDRSR